MQSSLQTLLFQQVKASMPPHLSLVEEIAEVLGISNDSAYRRIRGEKPIDLEEIQKLCSRFKVSMDQLLNLKSDAFIFTGNLNGYHERSFEDWLNNVLQQLQWLNNLEKKHAYFLIKDIPPFLHFQVPELAAFKFYFWMKSILHYESMKGVKFRFDDARYDEFHTTSKKIIELYINVPMTEIWNIESINSTLQQIEFHCEAGAFANKQDVRLLYLKVEELINHIELQAELGVKFAIGKEPKSNPAEYRLFVNELILGDNTFMVETGSTRITFLNHSVLYFVATHDEKFNHAMFSNLENLMKKSTHISTVGEKERNRFFNRMRENIHSRLQQLK
ncbi:MAG: helix-turn-helix domain-containing protein [Chitinophagaceae bacterium]